MKTIQLIDLSQQLLLAIKLDNSTINIREQLSNYSLKKLQNELYTDVLKTAFWINIYNAYFLILKKELKYTKPTIYRKKLFKIAGTKFSLDDVEHGILRKYRYKYSLGFFANLWYSKLIKHLAVHTIDYRIHFALNCGAKSCPPIAFYKVDTLELQLNLATQNFLLSETTILETTKEVHISALFKWYYNDFKGIKGIQEIYNKHIQTSIKEYKIVYQKYDWNEDLNNFTEESINRNVK